MMHHGTSEQIQTAEFNCRDTCDAIVLVPLLPQPLHCNDAEPVLAADATITAACIFTAALVKLAAVIKVVAVVHGTVEYITSAILLARTSANCSTKRLEGFKRVLMGCSRGCRPTQRCTPSVSSAVFNERNAIAEHAVSILACCPCSSRLLLQRSTQLRATPPQRNQRTLQPALRARLHHG